MRTEHPGWRVVLAASLTLALTSACHHRGPGWTHQVAPRSKAAPPQPGPPPIELIVLGQPRANHSTRRLTERLDALLDGDEHVIWLGADLGRPGPDRRLSPARCPGSGSRSEEQGDPSSSELAALRARLDAHQAAGGTLWTLPGPDEWRCKDRAVPGGAPFVLRFDAQGHAQLASSCDERSCTVAPPRPGDRLDIVGLDLSTWLYPELAPKAVRTQIQVQQAELLDALGPRTTGSPPRLLASTIPVDSAGIHGSGGRLERSGFHYLPPAIREALLSGAFAGVLSGLERSLQVSRDLSPAIVRSDRSFPAAPIFQVLSAAAGGARATLPTSRGHALLPELESDHLGFARLVVHEGYVDVELHARVASRWQLTRLRLPLEPLPHDELRPATRIQPCLNCDPVSGAADGATFVPRGEREP